MRQALPVTAAGEAFRRAAYRNAIPCVTTVDGALALVRSLRSGDAASSEIRSLQEWHG